VKNQNWILGFVISLAISLIAATARFIRMESVEIRIVTISILYNFFFCITCWTIYQYLFNRTKLLQLKKYRIVVAAMTILCVGMLIYIYDYLFSLFTDKTLPFPEITGSKRGYILLLRGLLVSGLFYFISYYLHVLAEKQKTNLEIEHLKQAQLAANLSSLKEQLSPHFLFNTLNTLSSLSQEKIVKDYVAELANVYRYVLQYKELDAATLKQELAFIESYLYIIKTRLENAIDVNIDVDKNALSSRIPPLTLQLLIENAIKHNIASSGRQLKIEIKSTDGNFLFVSNNFQPKTSVQVSTGMGLSNVMQRYRLLFDKEVTIEKTDNFFTIKLPIV
jgi:two-component system LytT family sensor kinase